jgi:ATP adenylyltransferase
MGSLLSAALQRSLEAEASGALVPLHTQLLPSPGTAPFMVRRLLSDTPKHLRSAGPKPNPFLPWDQRLELARPGPDHALILNKFPVQRGHLLLITQSWQPQSGWLRSSDWQVLAAVESECSGLWFFNSCAAAGASQPHRHLQLLPRQADEPSCPLSEQLQAQLEGRLEPWPWRYRLSRRYQACTAAAAIELDRLYQLHQRELGLGESSQQPQPLRPYNLLFDRHWFMTVERTQEHWAGFSVNALGYAGCLLVTPESDQGWLTHKGPWELLKAVAAKR